MKNRMFFMYIVFTCLSMLNPLYSKLQQYEESRQDLSWNEISTWVDLHTEPLSLDFPGNEDIEDFFLPTLKIRLKVVFAVLYEIIPQMSKEFFLLDNSSATLSLRDILDGFVLESKRFILDQVALIVRQRLKLDMILVFHDPAIITWELPEWVEIKR